MGSRQGSEVVAVGCGKPQAGKGMAHLGIVGLALALFAMALGSVPAQAHPSHPHARAHHRKHKRHRSRRLTRKAGVLHPPASALPPASSPALVSPSPSNGLGPSAPSSPEDIAPYSKEPAETSPYAVCPPPTKTRMSCMSAIVPTEDGNPVLGPSFEGSGELGGFSPADLRSAYNLPAEGGEGQKVAITIAYDDPNAESDLKIYREHYGLPECSEKNGCFEKVNGKGETKNYPAPEAGWAVETSLDLDMVSAACPKCHILLVEAQGPYDEYLFPAVEEAAKKSATVISDSWDGFEFSEETSWDHYLKHPGIPVLFASGDNGYNIKYPASSPEVIAVGGTTLKKDKSTRGWSEAAWSGSGSGCSLYEAKPTWQKDAGCAKRTVADAAAVASPATPVSVYDSYGQNEGERWLLVGGTSASSPLMAGVEAVSSSAFRAVGAEAFYGAGKGGELFDVTEGRNKTQPCGTYLCEGVAGYDGPTGEGTPNGPLYVSRASTEAPTIVSSSEATLHGSVNPEGHATEYHFEYDTKEYKAGEGGHGTSVPVPSKSAGSGTTPVAESETIKGLSGKTTYHFRIVATTEGVNTYGADRSFGTTAPTASTEAAAEVHGNDATLRATVNPEGVDTHYRFEYGVTTSYGNVMPLPAEGIGSGTAGIAVSQQIGGLNGEQTYHFRVRATNSAGTTYGSDKTLTTPATEWQLQSTASENFERLTRIACGAVGDCMSVGQGGLLKAISKHWNGKEWTNVAMPSLATELKETVESEKPTGIACSAEAACTMVGRYTNAAHELRPFAERWNGTKWVLEPGATALAPSGSELRSVSCPTASFCIAVGEKYVLAEFRYRTLAMSWNGKEWSLMTPLEPAGSAQGGFNSISCTTASLCMAGGYYGETISSYSGLAERWNGKEWTIFSVPAPKGVYPILDHVSCKGTEVSSLSCMGINARFSLVWRWSGSEWSLIKSPPHPIGGGSPLIVGVSCVTATECIVVGVSHPTEGSYLVPLVATWNGDQWSIQTTFDKTTLRAGDVSGLEDVSCPNATRCTAVGFDEFAPEGQFFPLAEFTLRAPTAITESASNLGKNEATLNGTVGPNAEETKYFFEYGPTSSYGSKTAEKSAGTGTSNGKVSAPLTGLAPGVYHFRLVASNEIGTRYGADWVFATTPVNSSTFGSHGSGNGQLSEASDLATDASGNVWVADTENSRLEEFNSKGEFVRTVGALGSGNGQFEGPYGVAVDSKGNVWASDTDNNRIEEFNSKGEFIQKFGSQGSGNAQFNVPEGLAVDSKGNLFIADRGNKRIEELNEKGEYVTSIGTFGEGQLKSPTDVVLDSAGNLFVSDYENSRIVEFSPEGTFIRSWGSAGSGSGKLSSAYRLTVGPEGNIWVAEWGNNRVQAFTPAGEYLYGFGSYGTGEGQFNHARGVAFSGTSTVYVLDSGTWDSSTNNRVEKWDLHTPMVNSSTFGSHGSGNGQLSEASDLATDASGNVWVADTENSRLEEFNSKGEFVRTVGALGSGNGQFEGPYGVAVDSKGNVWASDTDNNRIEEFNSKGEFIQKFGSQGSGNAQFNVPEGLAVDSKGNLFIADRGNKRIEELNEKGEYVTSIGTFGEGQLKSPTDVVLDSAGNLFVSDYENSRIVEFSPEGTFIRSWGSAGSGSGKLSSAYRLTVGPEGNIWVAEWGNNRVQAFTPAGEYLYGFGSYGTGEGQFNHARGVAFSGTSTVYVLDSGTWDSSTNNRVEKWVLE